MNIADIIAAILDQPALQEPAATLVAAHIKGKIPPGVEKDVKDFLTLLASKL